MKSLDKIKGVVFGQAIGDALGLGTEFMTQKEIQKHYPNGLNDYSQIVRDSHRSRWKVGDWTDDTDMMLCIAKSIIKNKKIVPMNIANKFSQWLNSGKAMGVGSTVYSVLTMPQYVQYPLKASELVWKMMRCNAAGNGGVMRTSIIGIWKDNVESYAADICKLTHYDARCVGSSVIISMLIHSLIYQNRCLSMEEMIEVGNRYDIHIKEYIIQAVKGESLDYLKLDEEKAMGYTLKTMAAAIWCLFHCSSFEEGLLAVVNAGGDADTNAAVTCSVLGAKFGYSSIPIKYINDLARKEELDNVIEPFIKVIQS